MEASVQLSVILVNEYDEVSQMFVDQQIIAPFIKFLGNKNDGVKVQALKVLREVYERCPSEVVQTITKVNGWTGILEIIKDLDDPTIKEGLEALHELITPKESNSIKPKAKVVIPSTLNQPVKDKNAKTDKA